MASKIVAILNSVVILGGGNMGSALAAAFLASGKLPKENLLIIEHSAEKRRQLKRKLGCQVVGNIGAELSQASMLILAIKPQDMPEVAPQVRANLGPKTSILSILAGSSLESIAATFPQQKKIFCCMPNLAVLVREGFFAVRVSSNVTPAERTQVLELLSSGGQVMQVESQDLLDATTAAAASGCGFFFAIIEQYIQSVAKLGFTPKEAETLVRATLRGTLRLWDDSNSSPGEWRERVTSKGGTTAAGLGQMNKHKLDRTLDCTLQAAFDRSRELRRR